MILDTLRSLFAPGKHKADHAGPPQQPATEAATATGEASTNVTETAPDSPQPNALQFDWLVVGLGNPGAKYATTPHNAGYWVVDHLRTAPWQPIPGVEATLSPAHINGLSVALVRSSTFMNDSGQPVARLAELFHVPAERIVIIHDELDLKPGVVRVKKGGSDNGHNGLKSLTAELQTADYIRIRVGIGRPNAGQTVIDHVLAPIDYNPQAPVDLAAEATRLSITDGVPKAQHVIHSRTAAPTPPQS